jgi:type 2 lantibiotic biosynthesis protein LanM
METQVETDYVQAAFSVGAKLCREAIWHQECCNWIGCEEMYSTQFQLDHTYKALGPGFYEGTSGIAFFLTHLYYVTHVPVFKITALGALSHAQKALEKEETKPGSASWYVGLSGIAYSVLTAGEILEQESLIGAALAQLQRLQNIPDTDLNIDVIDGVAGTIPILLYTYQKYPQPWLLAAARRFGDYLGQIKHREPVGCSWGNLDDCTHNLTGFGHGTAGVALALLELYRVTGAQSYLELAELGMAYENSWFDASEENWPDFRKFSGLPDPEEPAYGLAWCHGAPGIGLTRLRAYQITGREAYKREAQIAINTTAKTLLAQNNYSLCHGMFGNGELLLLAAEILQDEAARQIAQAAAQQGIEQIIKKGISWPCGLQSLEETPGLMLGIAGIGHYYLRLAYPHRIPSALFMSGLAEQNDG